MLRLTRGARREYVVQATKTSLDTYVAPLLMNNKAVSKMLLRGTGNPDARRILVALGLLDAMPAVTPEKSSR